MIDVFGYLLHDRKYGVEDLKLPENSFLTSIMFEDVTSLYLSSYHKNFHRAFKVLTHIVPLQMVN